jgi:MFS family permease
VIFSQNLKMAIPGVFLAGFGCACVYPIYIAWLSRWYGGRAKRIGAVMFALASLGGSTGPWLIGTVSKYSGSLRVGFVVPLASAVMMMGVVWWLRQGTRETA